MRSTILALSLLVAPLSPARAQAVFGIQLGGPAVSIGLQIPVYPQFVQVPGEPVYYAPQIDANYFFFDGYYWVFRGDRWFASARYDGPWHVVAPEYVPAYVLRVPVRYYRQPPAYFHGWRHEEAPRWGERWGRDWEHRRSGWDRHDAPRPAAAPVYRSEHRYAAPVGWHEARPEHRDDRSRGDDRRGGSDDRGRGRGNGHDDRREGGGGGNGHDDGHDRGRGQGRDHD
jgi:hypothetical protein